MKISKILIITLLLPVVACRAERPSPKLLVPYFETTIHAVEGEIFLPAFNLEIMKMWPEDLHAYTTILQGGKECVLHLRKNSQTQKILLEKALLNKDVVVFSVSSTTYGRNPGLIIEAAPGVTIISFQTRGLVISDGDDVHLPDNRLFAFSEGGYNLNTTYSYTYLLNQQKIWQALNKNLITDQDQLQKLTRSFVQNILSSPGNLPPYYSISLTNETVHIHASKIAYMPERSSEVYYNDNGQHFFMLIEIIRGFRQLVAYPEKDSINITLDFSPEEEKLDSIVITGKFKGIIPLRICYTSSQKIKLTAVFEEKQIILKPNIPYRASLILTYDFDEKINICKLKFPKRINHSNDRIVIKFNACTIPIEAKASDLVIDL